MTLNFLFKQIIFCNFTGNKNKMTPNKDQLIPGAIIEQGGEVLKLIEHQPSWRVDEMPFCVANISNDRQVAHAKQRWKVDVGGFITHRYIEYYHSTGHVSANCAGWMRLENDND